MSAALPYPSSPAATVLVVLCVYGCRKRRHKEIQAMSFDLGEHVSNSARSSIIAQFPDDIQMDSKLYDSESLDPWDDDEVIEPYSYNVMNIFAEDSQTASDNEKGSSYNVANMFAEDNQITNDNGECNSSDVAAEEGVATGWDSTVDVQDVGDEVEDSISLQSHTREDVPLV